MPSGLQKEKGVPFVAGSACFTNTKNGQGWFVDSSAKETKDFYRSILAIYVDKSGWEFYNYDQFDNYCFYLPYEFIFNGEL